MTIHVRKHARQLGSGKTVEVRQHERAGNAAVESTGIGRPSASDDGWWDFAGEQDVNPAGDHPEGTWFFNQDDGTYAVHPDGTTHLAELDAGAEQGPAPADPAEHPEGTWYFRDDGKLYAVYPDGSAREVPDEPEPASGAQDAPFGALGSESQAEDCPVGSEGREVLPSREPPRWPAPAGWEGPSVRTPSPAMTRMQAQMRDWRSRDIHVPPATPDTSPKGRLLGTDTQEGAEKFARGCAYRDAGYTGPLDQDNRIPDPDDPAEYESLSVLARMSEI